MIKGTMLCAEWEGTEANRRNPWSTSDDANGSSTSQLVHPLEGFAMTE